MWRGGAEARGVAAGWDSAAWGCSVWIGGGGTCAGGVQGRRGGARQGAEWEGRLEVSRQRNGRGVTQGYGQRDWQPLERSGPARTFKVTYSTKVRDIKKEKGNPLRWAAASGSEALARALVKCKADVEVRDEVRSERRCGYRLHVGGLECQGVVFRGGKKLLNSGCEGAVWDERSMVFS